MAIATLKLGQATEDPNKKWLYVQNAQGGNPVQYTLTPQQFQAFQEAGVQAVRESNNPLYYNQGAFDENAKNFLTKWMNPLPAGIGNPVGTKSGYNPQTNEIGWITNGVWSKQSPAGYGKGQEANTNILNKVFSTDFSKLAGSSLADPYADTTLWKKTPYMGGSQVTYIGPKGGPNDPDKGTGQTPPNIQQAGSQVGQTYTVKSGDTLSKIAQRLGVSVGQISGYRSGNPNLIYPGENLTIGGTSATQGGTPSGQLTPEQTKYFQDQIAKIQTGITSIQNPIPVSGQGAAPILPPQPSGAITQSYYSSAAQDLLKTRTVLEDAYTKQIADLQTKIDVSNKKIQDLNILQQEGIISNIETLSQPFREDLEKSERQRLYINQNFEDNQKLTNELDALLTEGNTIISEMKGVTGLAAIRNPRINDTITQISQRTGVIQAVMAARNNQINVAENMIDRSVNALAADKQDQINYYKTLYNFYQSQKNKEGSKLITLTKDQKTYLNAQIGLLENDLKISQDSADYIKKLLTNPSNALLIAQAGVTLGDPPEIVNTKIATQIQRQKVIDFTNKKIEDGYTPIPFPQTGQQGLATFNVGGQNLTFKAPPVRGTTPTESKEFARVKQIVAMHPGEWGNAADQIDREFGKGTATKYDDYLKNVYAGGKRMTASNLDQQTMNDLISDIRSGAILQQLYSAYTDVSPALIQSLYYNQ